MRWQSWLAVCLMTSGTLAVTSCITAYTPSSVAFDGGTLIIGSTGDYGSSGSASILARSTDGAWSQQAMLLPSYARSDEEFGLSVALSGDTVLIGSLSSDASGSAYLFNRDDTGAWRQQVRLQAKDGKADDLFGSAVALSGAVAVVGAPGNDDRGEDSGSAYVFTRDSAGRWHQQARLRARDGAVGDWFGNALALFGNTLAIGAYKDDTGDKLDSGSVYLFNRDSDGRWRQRAKLHPEDGAAGDWFGRSVALFGNTLVIGAVGYSQRKNSGAVYVFTRNADGRWTQQAKLTASDGIADRGFGNSVAIFGDTIAIGADTDEDNKNINSAYVFVRDAAGMWHEQAKIPACKDSTEHGFSVAVYGDTVLAGAESCFSVLGPITQGGKVAHFTHNKDGDLVEKSSAPGNTSR